MKARFEAVQVIRWTVRKINADGTVEQLTETVWKTQGEAEAMARIFEQDWNADA